MYVSGHSGVEYVLSLNKEKFWIIGTRTAVQRHLNTHVACKRRQAQVAKTLHFSIVPHFWDFSEVFGDLISLKNL